MTVLSPKAPPRRIAPLLYARLVQAARQPALYRDLKVPDTIEGRYEMVALHMALLLRRLQKEGRARAKLAQALLDYMAADFDRSIRELGIGDLGVARYMKRLGEGFYGRSGAYSDALQQQDDSALSQALLRNAYAGTDPGDPILAIFCTYVRRQAECLARQDSESIAAGEVGYDPVEGGSA
ncbi:MAG TPA: ubiquinol-cytochrome C chaperone family protein [Alphaproteobacteria bacterium]|nr:ubiquinol-cytochrome C chaperone family protein [Alphaproteobacteria bacterium]